LTIAAGVRFDRSTLLLARSQWSPRVGLSFRLTDSTVLRASVNRHFQPPQPEYLLLSSSEEARELSPFETDEAVGGADVEPERQWAVEAGLDHRFGQWRIDAAWWRRDGREVSDPNVFFGTTVIFPNAVAKGRAQGIDVRVEVPRSHGWSGYGSATFSKVVQTGPVTGGLFLEDDIPDLGPGVEFVPDHDQRVALAGGATWEHEPSGFTASLAARYESGTPIQRDDDDGDLEERPGAELVDFERGRVKPRLPVSLMATLPVIGTDRTRVLLRGSILNLFDDDYAYNFGNPFSGTHFGAPRTAAISLEVTFR
jgi:outer membrane receptor protein involved in Fe transport